LIAAPEVVEAGGAVPEFVGVCPGAVTVWTVVMVEPPGSVVTIVCDEKVVGGGVVEVVELVGGRGVVLVEVVVGVVVVVDVSGGGTVGVGVGVKVGDVVVSGTGAMVAVLVDVLVPVDAVDGSPSPFVLVLLEDMAKIRRLSRGYSL
jgi:hypothetical protein